MKFAGKWMELEKDHLHPYPEQKKKHGTNLYVDISH